MQGAKPLASPASDCLRHLQSLPYKCTCGRALSFSSANPALSFDSAPIPPTPFPGGEGGDQGYFMQGASPLASPRLNPRGTGSTCRCRRLNGGRAPGVAGSVSVSGARRGLSLLVARRPRLSLAFLPPSPLPPSQREGGDQGYFMQGASPLASPGIDRARHWLCLRETGSSGVAGGTPALPLSTPPPVNP